GDLRDRIRPPRSRPPARPLGLGARLGALERGTARRRAGAPLDALERRRGVRTQRLVGGGARGARVLRGARRGRDLPLEHLHGDPPRHRQGRRPAGVLRLQPPRPLRLRRRLHRQGRAPPAQGRLPRPHRWPHRLRRGGDRRLLPRRRDLPDRGLRPCARSALRRAPPRDVGRRRRLLALRHQDDLHRRGRGAGLAAPGAPRVRPRLPQLRQARAPGRRARASDERVHRRDRARSARAAGGDRGLEERGRAPPPRSPLPLPAGAARGDGLGALQVRGLRATGPQQRPGLRGALPPDHGRSERPAGFRLGGGEPLVRAPLLPRAGAAARRPAVARPAARPMKVLVTGGAGFIGSHVVDALIAAGHAVRVLDLASPQRGTGEVEHCRADLLDLGAVSEAAAGCDAIVHLAAVADVNDVVADPVRAERVNAAGTLNVLEAARRERAGRVVYGSTIWVYSDCEPGAVDEDTPLAPPRHLYSATKLAGELYCRSYAELYGVEYTILRFGIPYGPRAREATVIPAFVRRAEAGEPLEIAGDGQQSRRFVYVEDLAQGVVAALRPEAANRVYNLAGEETTT